ncbi:MAG: histidine ammonia-lyase, partial [Aeromonas veronii]
AVELLAAAQGLDFRAPLRASEGVEVAKGRLRAHVPFYDKDRYFAPDIEAAAALLGRASYNDLIPAGVLPSL